MAKRLTISVAAIPEEFERRIGMAAKLLAASGFDVQISSWDGGRRDLLIANVDDAYGRSAEGVARRRGDRVVVVSGQSSDSASSLPIAARVAEITHVLRTSFEGGDPSHAEKSNEASIAEIGGLLGTWLAQWDRGGDFVASSGVFSILVRRRAGRLLASTHSNIAAARSRFLRETWKVLSAQEADPALERNGISQSIDTFLIESCEANEEGLPLMEGRFRLVNWPDLATLHENAAALRMAAELTRRPLTVHELALRCAVMPVRANAFFWAAKAGGLLVSEMPKELPLPSPAPVAAPVRSLVSRLAKRFGIDFAGRP